MSDYLKNLTVFDHPLIKHKVSHLCDVNTGSKEFSELVNELAMRKIKLPYINISIDDNSSFTGLETRLESFIDVLKGDVND